MKKAKQTKNGSLRANYQQEDFPKGLARGKYAARIVSEAKMVKLAPEIHTAFPTSKAVNEALGSLPRLAKAAQLSKRSANGKAGKNRSIER